MSEVGPRERLAGRIAGRTRMTMADALEVVDSMSRDAADEAVRLDDMELGDGSPPRDIYGIDITSWRDQDAGARHWYGICWRRVGGEEDRTLARFEREVKRTLTAREAAELNRLDIALPFAWRLRPGDTTRRYHDRDALVRDGLAKINALWGWTGPVWDGAPHDARGKRAPGRRGPRSRRGGACRGLGVADAGGGGDAAPGAAAGQARPARMRRMPGAVAERRALPRVQAAREAALSAGLEGTQAMRALSVWQPWATLVAEGHKPFEFRRWMPPRRAVGQRIAIHASARRPRAAEIRGLIRQVMNADVCLRRSALEALDSTRAYPLGCHVCTAVLAGVATVAEVEAEPGFEPDSFRGDKHSWNDRGEPVYAWRLTGIRRLPDVPARGRLGLWEAGDLGPLELPA